MGTHGNAHAMKHGHTTMNLQANVKAWSGNRYHHPGTKKFRSVPSAGKMMWMLLWDFNRYIFEHYQDHGQMVNSAWYCALLEEELKPVIHNKLRGVVTN
jgi:hypothetical protein